MELVELKSIWHLINADINQGNFVDEQIITETIHKKSETEVGKIRRALQFKLAIGGFVWLLGVGLMIGIFVEPNKFNTLDSIFSPYETIVFYSTLIGSLATMLWFNYQAYRNIATAEAQALPLKKSLEVVISGMKKAMKFNIYSDTFMSPIIITWLLYAYAYRGDQFTWDWRILIIVSAPFVIGVLAYLLQRFMQKLKFGNYVKRLESYLEELE
jgi:hypothetical protein